MTLSTDNVAVVEKALNFGFSDIVIARELGFNTSFPVFAYRKKIGFTQEQVITARIRTWGSLVAGGATVEEIAKAYGLTNPRTVQVQLWKAGFSWKTQSFAQLTLDQREAITRLVDEGTSDNKLAKLIGVKPFQPTKGCGTLASDSDKPEFETQCHGSLTEESAVRHAAAHRTQHCQAANRQRHAAVSGHRRGPDAHPIAAARGAAASRAGQRRGSSHPPAPRQQEKEARATHRAGTASRLTALKSRFRSMGPQRPEAIFKLGDRPQADSNAILRPRRAALTAARQGGRPRGAAYGARGRRVARTWGYTGAMRDLPHETAQQIAKALYWDPLRCDADDARIASQLFDAHYHGAPVIVWRQQVSGVIADGKLGPKTTAAVKACDPTLFVMRFVAARLAYLLALKTWPTFGLGWAQRMADNLRLRAI
ncbi:hypothetical protein DFQ28_007417 [Apophysomyces sp. BC1034]|nr:hypothetical protein DFQ28_007417 [Apophysomyces sp. BC1034]